MIEETFAGPARATVGIPGRPAERRWFTALRRIPWAISPFVAFLVLIVAVAVLAPLILPHDPTGQSLRNRLLAPALLGGSNPAFPLGTDYLGRDILSRIIIGSQVSLVIGVAGLATAGVFGSLVGLVAGYQRGAIDEALMALADVQLAFPNVLLAIAVIAVLGPSLFNLILVLGLTGWVTYARVARGAVLKLRSEDFVEAVRCMGGGNGRILFRHILPNCASLLVVVATLHLARIVILESTLSFLGLGIQPPTPSWGGMISEGRSYLATAWWIAVFPGLALLLTTMSVSRIGDWLRDVLDPTLRSG
jgi:peptide/nickel transport system permease protein